MTPGPEVKHTPGPWRVAYRDGSGPECITSEGRDSIVATVGYHGDPEMRCDMTEAEQANAALIAAAPDLLAALKETAQLAQEMLSDRARSDRTGMGELLARQAARAILTTASAAIAIARAEGRDAK